MSFHSPAQLRERTNADSPISHGFLQRKCDRDQHTIADGEYTDLYSSGQLFNSASIGMFAASRFGHDFSQVKLHADEASQTLPSRRTPLTVQRFPKSEDEMTAPCPTCPEAESTEASAAAEMAPEEAAPAPETEHAPTPATPEPKVEAPTPEETPAPGLIVEDSTTELGPGQMRKSEFLAQLRTEVTRRAEAAMAGTGRTTAECPYLDYWFGYYQDKDSRHIERAIRRYAPETLRATTARDYIPMVAARVSRSVEVWARTGEVTGVPEGMPMGLPGMGLLGGVGRLISGIGGFFFKAREGGAKAPDDPQAIQAELGEGRPLESTARSRMESAFGMSFSHVRTHMDSTAAGLSDRLNARAFTVGEHIAFGSGEYRPGTLIGDALIAHEMAHVVQQRGASASVTPLETGDTGYNMLENDADKSALGAMASLWGNAKGKLADVALNAITRLRSGLSLQRCPKKEETCPKGDKSVSVDFVKLRDSAGNPTTDMANANKAFKKCCVKFTKVKDEKVPNNLSDRWLGGDTDLQVTSDCGTVGVEEKILYDKAKTKYGLASRMRVFYVKTYSGSTGLGYSNPPYCATGSAASYVNHVVIRNNTVKNTLAHEFGHILLNSGREKGIDNPSDTNNLMYGPGTGFVLDKSQCKKIYNNA